MPERPPVAPEPAADAAEPTRVVPAPVYRVPDPAPAAPGPSEPPAPLEPSDQEGWPREDTDSFEPVSLPEAIEPFEFDESAQSKPVLRRLAAGSARDFDWGE